MPADCPKCGQNERKEANVKEWLDSPAPYHRQRLEEDYWCYRCKEYYPCTLRFDNEVGHYYGNEDCPFCGWAGVQASELSDKEVPHDG